MLDFSQLLDALGAATHLDTAAALQDGGCTLAFDQKLEVTFELSKDQRSVYVFAPVLLLPAPGANREAVLQTLLQVHLFGMATNGAYFGLDPQLSRAILFKTLELDHLDAPTAIASIEALVNDLERWQQALLDLALRLESGVAHPAAETAVNIAQRA